MVYHSKKYYTKNTFIINIIYIQRKYIILYFTHFQPLHKNHLLKLIYKWFYIMIMEQSSRNNHKSKYNNQERMCYYVTSISTNKALH